MNQRVPEENLYTSTDIPHIQGNVVHGLHMTLYYGQLDRPAPDQLPSCDIKVVRVQSLAQKVGYQSLYYILMLQISLETAEIEQINKTLRYFALKDEYSFDGHVTLAYIKQPLDDLMLLENEILQSIPVLRVAGLSIQE